MQYGDIGKEHGSYCLGFRVFVGESSIVARKPYPLQVNSAWRFLASFLKCSLKEP